MYRKAFSFLLIFALLASLFVPVQAADYDLLLGDVDNDNIISAGDARLVLRKSVGLASFDDSALFNADVDSDTIISAGDARLILRVSVGLENIENYYHKHTLKDISTHGSCLEATIVAEECEVCGWKNLIEVIPAPGHDWNDYIRLGNVHSRDCKVCGALETGTCELVEVTNRPATCTQDGLIERACVCGLKEQEVIPGSHAYGAWQQSANNTFASTCTLCGDKKTASTADILSWFNDNVNRLKTAETADKAVTVLRYTNTKNTTSDYSLSIKAIESIMRSALDTETLAYSAPTENRKITNNLFPAMTKSYVSNLTTDDIKSMQVKTGQTVNVLQDFPQTFDVVKTVSGEAVTTTYDIAEYKNTPAVTDAIKITIQVKDETATATGQMNGGRNVYTYQSGNKTITDPETDPLILERFYGLSLPTLCSQFPQIETTEGMGMTVDCPGANSAGTADWYFDSTTLEPIACVYNVNFNMNQAVTLDVMSLLEGNFDMATVIDYRYIFLFNDYYPCMAN